MSVTDKQELDNHLKTQSHRDCELWLEWTRSAAPVYAVAFGGGGPGGRGREGGIGGVCPPRPTTCSLGPPPPPPPRPRGQGSRTRGRTSVFVWTRRLLQRHPKLYQLPPYRQATERLPRPRHRTAVTVTGSRSVRPLAVVMTAREPLPLAPLVLLSTVMVRTKSLVVLTWGMWRRWARLLLRLLCGRLPKRWPSSPPHQCDW